MKTITRSKSSVIFYVAFVALFAILSGREAFSQAPYYEGKTIRIIRGGGPGGLGDMQPRSLIPYLKKYIPGEPNIVIQYMPGAAGRKMANHLYNVAPPDGLTIGALGGGLAVGPILDLPGVRYELDRFIYLGSTSTGEPYVFFTRAEAGLNTIEKLREASGVRIGAQAVGRPIYYGGRLMAYLLSLKSPRFVTGYGGPELDLAVMSGEVDGRLNSAPTVIKRKLEWIEKELVNLHVTITVPKGRYHPRFADLPDLDTFVRSRTEQMLVDLFRVLLYPRWPFILPPGTPGEQVQILRSAFLKAFKDPGFQEMYEKLTRADPSPLSGEEVQEGIEAIPQDPEVISLFRKIAGGGPLPSRK